MEVAFKILLTLGSLALSTIAFSQDLGETLEYLNTTLKENKATATLRSAISYDQLSIDNRGRLSCNMFLENSETGEVISKGRDRSAVYLKGIKSLRDFTCYPTNISIKLSCTTDSCKCVAFSYEARQNQELKFMAAFTNEEARRFLNALNHLVDLARTEPTYYSKDPFCK